MAVTIECPEGTRMCTGCGGYFPLDSNNFPVSSVLNKASGKTSTFFRKVCRKCYSAQETQRKKAREVKTPEPPEDIAEKILDACFTGEQVVYRRGANVRWRHYGGPIPADAELLGRFNLGADYRDVLGAVTA